MRDGAEQARRARRTPASSRSQLAAVAASAVPGMVALALCCYQLTLPLAFRGVLAYDDGVYFGSALYLVHGVLPYRDYVFVAPPGITVLMAPIALLSHLVGTANALGLARVATGLVAGANATLAALVVRHHGAPASLAAGLVVAAMPGAYYADSSVLLEPYLVLFVLIGAVLLFRRGEIASPTRVLAAGVSFGFAGAVKPWAILPFAVAVLCCLPAIRRALVPLVVGAVLGFGVPTLPFALLAPGAFFKDAISAQLARSGGGRSPGVASRLRELTGLGPATGLGRFGHLAEPLVIGALALGAAIVAVAALRGRSDRLDAFALGAAVSATAAVLAPAEYYAHYAYFVTPMFALLVGVSVGRVGAALPGQKALRPLAGAAACAALLLGGLALVGREVAPDRQWYRAVAKDPGLLIARAVPAGACVVSDFSSYLIAANRLSEAQGGCPAVLDSYGTWLATDPSSPPHSKGAPDPALVARWKATFAAAKYVVLGSPNTFRIPWTPELLAYFNGRFVRLPVVGAAIYGLRPGAH